MKLKTIVSIILIGLIIFIIYIMNIDRKIYYLNINDKNLENKLYNDYIYEYLKNTNKLEKYIDKFSNQDYRITDLIRDIESNKTIELQDKEQSIQNALIKADIVTLKMGTNELDYKVSTSEINELFEYCDTLLKDIEDLFIIIKKYCKEDIYFLGLYNNHSDYYDEIYNYLNLKIEDLSYEYDIKFINIDDLKDQNENIKISEKIIEKEMFDWKWWIIIY